MNWLTVTNDQPALNERVLVKDQLGKIEIAQRQCPKTSVFVFENGALDIVKEWRELTS